MEDIEDMFKGEGGLDTTRPAKPLIKKNKKAV